jgi:AbrB family looped-hinge helix DNA binding protein
MKTTVSSKGQIVLPAELREQDAIRAGQQFEVERVQPGEYVLRKISPNGSSGVLDWLLACPEKNWFRQIESESTADL